MDYDDVDEARLHPLKRLQLQVGRFVLGGAALDQEVTKIVSALANFGAPHQALAYVEGRNAVEKLDMLDAVLPPNMTNRGKVVEGLQALNNYRNLLAHSTVEVDVEAITAGDELESVYRLVKEKRKGSRRTVVDFDELSLKALQQQVMTVFLYTFRLEFHRQLALFDEPFSAMDVFLLHNKRVEGAQANWWAVAGSALGEPIATMGASTA